MAEWFAEWFDTPFYHILYKSRGKFEAHKFIDNLAHKLNFRSDWRYCDMACGKGRHAIYLNSKNFEVTGLDLSPNNIWHAKFSENEKLKFYKHDIRDTFRPAYFDVMLNLFTSFGYFENQDENQKAVKAMSDSLKTNGILILDYMNSRKAVEGFTSHYEKNVDGIQFSINKKIELGFIFKNISFENEGKKYQYQERVKILFLEDFKHFFEASDLVIIDVYGDYELNPYQDLTSDRMIMVCKKELK